MYTCSHNPLSGLRAPTVPSLASLVAAWPCLQTLDLRNTSGYDNHKNSSLSLPQELAGCHNLRELWLGWNANLDWGSLQVLQHCTVRKGGGR